MYKILNRIIKMFEEDEASSKEFKAKYRMWPFFLWMFAGGVVGGFAVFLPPGPDSAHFVDPSVKCLAAFAMFCILTLKAFVKLSRK